MVNARFVILFAVHALPSAEKLYESGTVVDVQQRQLGRSSKSRSLLLPRNDSAGNASHTR